MTTICSLVSKVKRTTRPKRTESPDRKGGECGNKIWFITNKNDKEAFDKRYSKRKSNLNDARSSGDKRGPNAGKKVGPAGKVLVVEVDVGFAASVIKKGADKPRAESGNPIWCFTNELSYGAFKGRYLKGGKHLTGTRSASKFTMIYGIDPTKMVLILFLVKSCFAGSI